MDPHKHLLCLLFPGALSVSLFDNDKSNSNFSAVQNYYKALDWIVKARQSMRKAFYANQLLKLFLTPYL